MNNFSQVTIANISTNTYTVDGTSAIFEADGLHLLWVQINSSAFTGGTNIMLELETLGPDGNWYGINSLNLPQSSQQTMYNNAASAGMQFTSKIRLVWVMGAVTAAPFSFFIVGQA